MSASRPKKLPPQQLAKQIEAYETGKSNLSIIQLIDIANQYPQIPVVPQRDALKAACLYDILSLYNETHTDVTAENISTLETFLEITKKVMLNYYIKTNSDDIDVVHQKIAKLAYAIAMFHHSNHPHLDSIYPHTQKAVALYEEAISKESEEKDAVNYLLWEEQFNLYDDYIKRIQERVSSVALTTAAKQMLNDNLTKASQQGNLILEKMADHQYDLALIKHETHLPLTAIYDQTEKVAALYQKIITREKNPVKLEELLQSQFNLYYYFIENIHTRLNGLALNNQDKQILVEQLIQAFKSFFTIALSLYKLHHSEDLSLESRNAHDRDTKIIFTYLFDFTVAPPSLSSLQLLSSTQFEDIVRPLDDTFKKFIIHGHTDAHIDQSNPIAPLNDEKGLPIFTVKELASIGQDNAYENPGRIATIPKTLKAKTHEIKESDLPDQIKQIHHPAYIHYLQQRATLAGLFGTTVPVDKSGETLIDEKIFKTACQTVNAARAAAKLLVEHSNYFAAACITRPPGHHAAYAEASGFCFFNNAFIAADYFLKANQPTIIIDFDIHHGDGTLNLMKHHYRPTDSQPNAHNIYFINFYNSAIWPYTDVIEDAPSNTFNIALDPTKKVIKWDTILAELNKALQIIKNKGFTHPNVVFSAGFDGHCDEIIESEDKKWSLKSEDYKKFVVSLSAHFPNCKMLAILEGGYAASAVAESIQYIVFGLNEHQNKLRNQIALTSTPSVAGLFSSQSNPTPTKGIKRKSFSP